MPLSRRQFVARSAVAATALPFISPFASAASRASRAEFRMLRRGVGAFTDRGGTIGYLQSPDALVAVDSQFPESAQAFLDGLEGSGRGLDLLVNTHHHGDHTAGNSVLAPRAATHVAHQAVPGLQRARAVRGGNLDGQRYASTLFERTWSQDLGDEVVSLHYFGPAHTCGDVVVHFERADVVHMGDLMFNGRQPFIDRDGGALTSGWMSVLETVHGRHTDETVFIFGHSGEGYDVVGGRADLLRFRDFLAAVNETVAARLAAGMSAAEMEGMEIPGFEDWGPAPMRVIEPVVAEQQG